MVAMGVNLMEPLFGCSLVFMVGPGMRVWVWYEGMGVV